MLMTMGSEPNSSPDRSWRSGVAMDFDILAHKTAGTLTRVVIVRFWGQYKVPGSRVEGSHFLAMVIAAATAWARRPVLRLVVDFSELDYQGGDSFLRWMWIPNRCGFPRAQCRIAIVWSDRNRARIRSLMDQFDGDTLVDAIFDDLERAVQWAAAAD